MKYKLKIIDEETSVEEVLNLSVLSGPSDVEHYRKIMREFISNSISKNPDIDKGIVYGFYDGKKLIASARIKQDEFTFTAMSIEYVAVKEELQGKGIGTLFFEALFDEIKSKWKKKIAVLATSERTHGFYKKLGMQVLGKMRNGWDIYRVYLYKWL